MTPKKRTKEIRTLETMLEYGLLSMDAFDQKRAALLERCPLSASEARSNKFRTAEEIVAKSQSKAAKKEARTKQILDEACDRPAKPRTAAQEAAIDATLAKYGLSPPQ